MPRVTVQRGDVQVHCTPAQVEVVASKLQQAGSGDKDLNGSTRSHIAGRIGAFVAESHPSVGGNLSEPMPDLRHAVLALRRLALGKQWSRDARNRALDTLKKLARLHVCDCELHHFSDRGSEHGPCDTDVVALDVLESISQSNYG